MKRKLLAFGDSHTSGAEIDEKWSGSCYEKAYPAHIANYHNWDYENYAQCGGSNDWLIKKFIERIQKALIEKEKVFVLCNIAEPSRTYIQLSPRKIQHCTSSCLDSNVVKELSVHSAYIKRYAGYLKCHTEEELNFKSLSHIFTIQSICKVNKIPYLFHSSNCWIPGDWSLIDKNNFFGHHKTNKLNYNQRQSYFMQRNYSYWGVAQHHPDWKHLQKEERWSMHYPEPYHEFWAKILLKFIHEQSILDISP